MSDATFILLDTLLGAAKGIVAEKRFKSIKEQYNINEDSRDLLTKLWTNPIMLAVASAVTSYFVNKRFEDYAKDKSKDNFRRNI